MLAIPFGTSFANGLGVLTVRRLLNRVLEETCGQDLAEYALLVALLVLSAVAVLPD